MAVDVLFTSGLIAAREKYLLKDKILRMCEMSADEAFRTLIESGFGGGEAATVHEYDKLVEADERSIDDFIREFATSQAELDYLLCQRDYHNAKALVKAEHLGTSPEKLLAPEGRVSTELMLSCFKANDFTALAKRADAELLKAIQTAQAYLSEGGDSGSEVGAIFERAMYEHLSKSCKRNRLLKRLVGAKADMTNILTALRSSDPSTAKKYYVSGGKLSEKQLSLLFDTENAETAFKNTEYGAFVKLCLTAKLGDLPMTAAERMRDSFDGDYLAANKYELKNSQPFLYYVFRRRAENNNVRIVFVCLLSGMQERDIKNRLRAV